VNGVIKQYVLSDLWQVLKRNEVIKQDVLSDLWQVLKRIRGPAEAKSFLSRPEAEKREVLTGLHLEGRGSETDIFEPDSGLVAVRTFLGRVNLELLLWRHHGEAALVQLEAVGRPRQYGEDR